MRRVNSDGNPCCIRFLVLARPCAQCCAVSRGPQTTESSMAERIESYALIGDCESAALVSREGSVNWLCWPRFDSDACFAALLGDPSHGRWRLAPRDPAVRITRRYLEDTLILETRFETHTGVVTVLDFMPPRDEASDLIRVATCERGEVDMHMELVLRFGYGALVPWITHIEPHA